MLLVHQNAKLLCAILQFFLIFRVLTATQVVSQQALLGAWTTRDADNIDLSNALIMHDKELRKKRESFLYSLFAPETKSAVEEMKHIVVQFNDQSRKHSHNVEQACTELMNTAHDQNLFDMSTASFSFQDEHTPEQYASSASLMALWEYVSPSSKPEHSWKEKEKTHKRNMFQRAKFYCAYGYNLQLVFNETHYTLQVVGDKQYYSWMTSVLDQLLYNLAALTASTELLISTQQRLFVLKKLTEKVSDIVRYSAYTKLEKIMHVPSVHTMTNVNHYLESELTDIANLVERLHQIFPLQMEHLQHQQAITKANADLNRILQDIVEERSDVASQLHQREAERRSSELVQTWNATKTVLSGWRDVVIHSTEFGVQTSRNLLGTLISEITGNFLVAPIVYIVQTVFSCIPFAWVFLLLIVIALGSYVLFPITVLVKIVKTPIVYLLQKLNQFLKGKEKK